MIPIQQAREKLSSRSDGAGICRKWINGILGVAIYKNGDRRLEFSASTDAGLVGESYFRSVTFLIAISVL